MHNFIAIYVLPQLIWLVIFCVAVLGELSAANSVLLGWVAGVFARPVCEWLVKK